jgi:xylulose-5-phosphate/fructose-6-phosphate phosphoketolase
MLSERAAYAKQSIREKLQDHKQYIEHYGDVMPEIRNWQWGGTGAPHFKRPDTSADNI